MIHNPNVKTLQHLLGLALRKLYGSDFSDQNVFDYICGKDYPTYGYSNRGENLLRTSVMYSNHDIVEAIINLCNHLALNKKYDFINEKDAFNRTLLIDAARYNKKYPKVIEILIEASAEDTPDDQKVSALTYAVREHNNEAVKILVDAGAYVDYVRPGTDGGQTALTYAVEKCNIEALKILIKAGADVNKGKIGQYSAFQYAELMVQQTKNIQNSGRLEQVKSMLNQLENKVKQASTLMEREILEAEYIKAKTIYDEAVFEQSKNGRFAECVKLLTQAGAK